MNVRRVTAVIAPILAVVAIQMAGSVTAVGGGSPVWLSLDAAAFEAREETTHYAADCGALQSADDREFRGTVNGAGGYIGNVNLPQGATIQGFLLSVRDNDADLNVHGYLLRKRLAPQPGGEGFGGYVVLAQTTSSGASTLLRRFADDTIPTGGTVDNSKFAYFAEIVNCGDTVEPIGIQVVYRR